MIIRVGILLGGTIILGCAIKPSPSNYLEYQTKTDLMFPLTGEALIGTGGRTKKQNPDHIYAKDQRFPIDIVALAPGAQPPAHENLVDRARSYKLEIYQDNYKKNEHYYCFDRQIIAPGYGVVVDAMDGIFDNIPGKSNTKDIPGNYVVIDHLNGWFSMLGHFRKGSVLVSKGEKVCAGAPIGYSGNSGNSGNRSLA